MLTAGTRLGRYEIVAPLGAGGMGEVYRAHDARLNRDVAIKVLPADRSQDEAAAQRFLREARAASALNHPNIITIYETDTHDGVAFIAMEYIRGRTLADVLGEGLSDADGVGYAIQIADALAKAHAAGIVHRDLKPGNVMITADGLVKVLDFGLAKFDAAASAAEAGGDLASDVTRSAALVSMPGSTLGTLSYMSPEQARGEPVDSRSDIFSFGIVLFEILTRQLPFAGENLLAVLHNLHFGAPKDIRYLRPDLDPAVAAIVGKCLQKKPSDRYQNSADLCRDLRAAAGQHSAIASTTTLPRAVAGVTETKRREVAAVVQAATRRWKSAAIVLVLAIVASMFAVPSLRHKIVSLTNRNNPSGTGATQVVPDNPFALQQQAQTYLERWDVSTNLDRSITLLNRAIELDHDYAPAYASLTFAYFEKNRVNPDS
ncbi:MAG: protein kinase, partial [Candidatus Angelobacter sp.]